MDKVNNDYIQKRDKLLTDVYQIGRTDATLQADDWKELQAGVQQAFDALLLETVAEARIEVLRQLANGTKGQRGSRFTDKQMSMMSYILAYTEQYGYQPGIEELAEHFGVVVSTASERRAAITLKAERLLAELDSTPIGFHCALGCGKFTTNAELNQHIAEDHEAPKRKEHNG